MAAVWVRIITAGAEAMLAEGPALACIWLVSCWLMRRLAALPTRSSTLPTVEELELAGCRTEQPHGDALLHLLLAGSASSLRRLSLHAASFGCGLTPLAAATALSHLNLAGAPVASSHVADLALLPLAWLSLSKSQCGDEGMPQLLAPPLRHLDLRCMQRMGRLGMAASAASLLRPVLVAELSPLPSLPTPQ